MRTLLLKPVVFTRTPSQALSSAGLNTLSLASPAQQAPHFSESTGSLYLHLLYSKSCLSTEVRATRRAPGLTHAHLVQKSSLYRKSMTQCVLFFPWPCHPTGNSHSLLFLLPFLFLLSQPSEIPTSLCCPVLTNSSSIMQSGQDANIRWSISAPQHCISLFQDNPALLSLSFISVQANSELNP